jgi:hypothetical protein
MEITKNSRTERHEVTAVISLLAADDGSEDFTGTDRRWSHAAREYQRIPFTWRPERARLSWRWSTERDEWLLIGASLDGYKLKKDGKVGTRRESESFIHTDYHRGTYTLSDDAPDYLRQAIEGFAPTSRVSSGATA